MLQHYIFFSWYISLQAAIELLQLGADTSLKNSDGQTAQDLAPESWKHRFR